MNKTGMRAKLATVAALVAATITLIAGSAQAASTLPTLTLNLTPTTIAVGGTLQSGAVNVRSTATGTKEASAVLFLVKPGVTGGEVEAFLKTKAAGDPNNADKYGSIVFDAEVSPGQPSEVQTNLVPGQYFALVAEGEGGPKVHTSFTVTASASPAALPTPDATIRSIEFGFRGPSTLHDGELVRFENEGFLVHMDIAAPVKNMKAAKQAVKLLLAGKGKQLEKLIVGPGVTFAGPHSSGTSQQETITAKPGIYVEVCFMETQDGRDHSLLGMERIIRITK